MSYSQGHRDEPAGQWGAVVVAWIFVGIPLLWGVYETLQNAMRLFR